MTSPEPITQVGPGENLSSGMTHIDRIPEIMIDREVANPLRILSACLTTNAVMRPPSPT